jgi:hypothetical protein
MRHTEAEVDQEDEEDDNEDIEPSERKGRRDRPGVDKSVDPLYQRVTVYLPKALYQRIRRRMANDNSRDLSQIITAGVIRELKATSPRSPRSATRKAIRAGPLNGHFEDYPDSYALLVTNASRGGVPRRGAVVAVVATADLSVRRAGPETAVLLSPTAVSVSGP